MKKLVMLTLVAGVLSSAATVCFADPLEKAVKARRGYLQAMYFNAGPLFGMLKGKVPYDAVLAKKLANNVKLISQMSNDAMWPKGSDNAALKGKTRALPAIWAAGSDFGDKWGAWRKAVSELAAVAGDGKDGLAAKVKAMGGTCSACHKAFRAKEF
jgi:cytochrome c556